jgi:DNA-binding MarR family transcriptional regulator
MEDLGLIYREASSGDKRSVKVFLTPFGIEKRKLASNVVIKFNEYLNDKLSAKEKEQLISILDKVNQLTLAYSPKKEYDEKNK